MSNVDDMVASMNEEQLQEVDDRMYSGDSYAQAVCSVWNANREL